MLLAYFRQVLLLIGLSSLVSSLLWLFLLISGGGSDGEPPVGQPPFDGSFVASNPARYQQTCLDSGDDDKARADGADEAQVLLPYFSHSIINASDTQIYPYRAYGRRCAEDETRPDIWPSCYSIVIIAIVDRLLHCPEPTGWWWGAESDSIQLNCAFHDAVIRSPARVRCIPEHHDYRFAAAVIQCRAFARFDSLRLELTAPNLTLLPWVPIQYPTFQENRYQDAVVCVRPLYGAINLFNWLEFLAYYKWQGFQHFVFYHYHLENDLDPMLAQISSIPGVQLEPFPMSAALYQEVHAGGQLAAMNDCLYRFPGSVQLHIDLDEFVMTSSGRLIEAIDRWYYAAPVSHVALYFRNVFHCHEYNQRRSAYYEFERARTAGHNQSALREAVADPARWRSLMLVPNSPRCQRTAWPYEIRSKVMMLRPWLVDQVGVHQVWQFVQTNPAVLNDRGLLNQIRLHWYRWRGRTVLLYRRCVPEQEAVLRHFRWCCHMKQPSPHAFFLSHFDTLADQVDQCLPDPANETWQALLGQMMRQWYEPEQR